MPPKTKILLLSFAVLSLIAGFVWLGNNNNDTQKSEENTFAMSDSGMVRKINLLYKNTNIELLYDSKNWLVNQSYRADDEKMTQLLSFVHKAEVKHPVYKEQLAKINQVLDSEGIEISITSQNNEIKKYKLLPNPEDPSSIYARMEGYKIPYLLYLPGFEADFMTVFSTQALGWKNRIIFNSPISKINAIQVKFQNSPQDNFEIKNNGLSFSVEGIKQIDTLRLMSYLKLFDKVAIKEFLPASFKQIKDSLEKVKPSFFISLSDKNPVYSNQISIFYTDQQKGNIYAFVGKTNELVSIRAGIFEYLLQKKSFFEFTPKSPKEEL